MASTGVVNTAGFERLAADLAAIDRSMNAALGKTLGGIASDAQEKISSSHATPYKTGTLRQSVVDEKDSLFDYVIASPVAYSRIWNFGGTVIPNGTPIEIPRTEYADRQIRESGDNADEMLAAELEVAAREHGWT